MTEFTLWSTKVYTECDVGQPPTGVTMSLFKYLIIINVDYNLLALINIAH